MSSLARRMPANAGEREGGRLNQVTAARGAAQAVTENTRGKIGAEPTKANQADQVWGLTCQEI